jgi:signal transduction histidine kinase
VGVYRGDGRLAWSSLTSWGLAGIALLGAGSGVLIAVWSHSLGPIDLSTAVGAVAFGAAGLTIICRLPEQPVGWILGAVGALLGVKFAAEQYGGWDLYEPAGPHPGGIVALSMVWLYAPIVALLGMVFPVVFPSGRLLSPRWRIVLWAAAVFVLCAVVGNAFLPGYVDERETISNPIGIAGAESILHAAQGVASAAFVVGVVGGVAALVIRFRRASPDVRQQMKWLVPPVVVFVVGAFVEDWSTEVAGALRGMALLLLPVAVAVAVLRYRLYALDIIVSRAVVYTTLIAVLAGAYVATVGLLGLLLGDGTVVPFAGAVVIAWMFDPLRTALRRRVDRMLFGDRSNPYRALARLGERLETATAPETVLAEVVDVVAEALRVPFVAVVIASTGDVAPAAAHGTPTGPPTVFPLVHQGEVVGHLEVCPRRGDIGFTAADHRLLTDLARQAGAAARALELTVELQRSRAALVTAREEERRRLRRDLHDGLGPSLAAIALGLDVASTTVTASPAAACTMLGELRADTLESLAGVRQLVYGLRPPALDDLGLRRALQEQLNRFEQGEANLTVTIDGGDGLDTLPAAVEVAVYRIVCEAVANVVRHARARHCVVRMHLSNVLDVEIGDDGTGLPADHRPGVGMAAMRERATELGGTFSIGPRAEGGTCVHVVLPVMSGQ